MSFTNFRTGTGGFVGSRRHAEYGYRPYGAGRVGTVPATTESLLLSRTFANLISSRLRFEFFEFAISDFSISDFEKSVAIEPRSRRINRDAVYTDPHFFAAPLS